MCVCVALAILGVEHLNDFKYLDEVRGLPKHVLYIDIFLNPYTYIYIYIYGAGYPRRGTPG
jgi:hypothetical protein